MLPVTCRRPCGAVAMPMAAATPKRPEFQSFLLARYRYVEHAGLGELFADGHLLRNQSLVEWAVQALASTPGYGSLAVPDKGSQHILIACALSPLLQCGK